MEKEKTIQDIQYKNLEVLLEKQSVEEKVSSDSKRLNELVYKYVNLFIDFFKYYFHIRNHLLEDELDRVRRSLTSENITIRR